MSKSYEDYESDYQSYLSRIRSFLASTRSQSTLRECERLLGEARKCVSAMQGMAEVAGDSFKAAEAKRLLERDITPLQQEVSRGLGGGNVGGDIEQQDLFYQPPGGAGTSLATEALIQSSDDLLRESQALVAETEQIGMSTLTQMGTQREQMQIASDNMEATYGMTMEARLIMRKIQTKILKNKLCLWSIIMVLLIANGFVIYLIWKKNHRN